MFKKYPQPLNCKEVTLLETNMETQKRPYKDYSPSKMGLYGFPCKFGGVQGFGETFGLDFGDLEQARYLKPSFAMSNQTNSGRVLPTKPYANSSFRRELCAQKDRGQTEEA